MPHANHVAWQSISLCGVESNHLLGGASTVYSLSSVNHVAQVNSKQRHLKKKYQNLPHKLPPQTVHEETSSRHPLIEKGNNADAQCRCGCRQCWRKKAEEGERHPYYFPWHTKMSSYNRLDILVLLPNVGPWISKMWHECNKNSHKWDKKIVIGQ